MTPFLGFHDLVESWLLTVIGLIIQDTNQEQPKARDAPGQVKEGGREGDVSPSPDARPAPLGVRRPPPRPRELPVPAI